MNESQEQLDKENKLLLKFANTPIGRHYFGIPENKKVIKITDGSIHFLTGELSKNPKGYGLPVICVQGSPGGYDLKRKLKFLEFFPDFITLALLNIRYGLPLLLNADTGYKSPSGNGENFNQWTNGANAYTSDNNYATAQSSDEALKVHSWSTFGFNVPSGAIINGIQMSIECYYTGNVPYQKYANWRCKSDSVNANPETVNYPTSENIVTVGGSTDLWGRTPIDTDFSDANFYMFLSVEADIDETTTVYVDHIQVKVYYMEATGPTGVKTINDLAIASVKTINNTAIANVKKIQG